jgi:hypothetical protein
MKTWFSKSKSTPIARKTENVSDDLMAQISGGAGKGACHTVRLTAGIEEVRSLPALQMSQLAAF